MPSGKSYSCAGVIIGRPLNGQREREKERERERERVAGRAKKGRSDEERRGRGETDLLDRLGDQTDLGKSAETRGVEQVALVRGILSLSLFLSLFFSYSLSFRVAT